MCTIMYGIVSQKGSQFLPRVAGEVPVRRYTLNAGAIESQLCGGVNVEHHAKRRGVAELTQEGGGCVEAHAGNDDSAVTQRGRVVPAH